MTKNFFLLLFLVLGVIFFVFLHSFNLGLFGDDWLAFWRYLQYLGPKSSGEWTYLTYFFTSYGPEDIFMGLLQKIYGYESFYYFLTSFILRIFASLSLFPLILYFTKSKSASLISCLFFLITTTGIETTNWVFNMPSYLSIIFLNFFFYYFLISQSNFKKIILTISFFTLALITQPIRMHGLLPTIFLLEFIWIIQKRKIDIFKKSIFRAFLFSTITIILIFLGLGKSPIATPGNLLSGSMKLWLEYILNNKFDVLLNPLVTLGGLILPSNIPLFFLSPKGVKNLLLLIGIILILAEFKIFIHFYKKGLYNISTAIFLSTTWSLFSFIFAWWREPFAFFLTVHRYLIVSAIGISIFIGVLYTIPKNTVSKRVIFLIIVIIFLMHGFSSRNYLIEAETTHNKYISDKIWASIPNIPEVGKTSEPVVFYFAGDGTNETILRDVITFGFPPHMGLIYNFFDEDKTPIPMSDFKEVISAVMDGKSFAPYGHPQKSISIQRVYAFQLLGKDTLINTTEFIRQKLLEIKQ